MAKETVRIADLVNLPHFVEISDTQQIKIRGLSLKEMVLLLIESKDIFLTLYGLGLDDNMTVETLAPFLLTAPDMIAKIIAFASDEPDQAQAIEHFPGPVQLTALAEVWKLSVPDPKKARELLSEVTALLQKWHGQKQNEKQTLPLPSPTTLPLPSIS